MFLGERGPENRYSPDEVFYTLKMLQREFVALGCDAVPLREVLHVSKHGRACFLIETETSFTSLVGFRIFKDKESANRVLRLAAINVADQQAFSSLQKDRARRVVRRMGIAVIKPSDGHKGKGVCVGVTEDGFEDAWQAASGATRSRILVEKFFEGGTEGRYLVVDGQCVAVLARSPPAITGDGVHTVRELIAARNAIRATNPHLRNRLIEVDAHRLSVLRSQGYDLASVPPDGERVLIDHKGGFSTGANSCNITDEVHPLMKRVAERAAGAVPGLDVLGVDILAHDHRVAPTDVNYIVVEANTRPGIGGHHFPVFGAPVNVCRLIAESCIRKMGFELPARAPEAATGGEALPVRPEQVAAENVHVASALRSQPPDARRSAPGKGTETIVLVGDTSLGDAYLTARWREPRNRLQTNPASFFEHLHPLISDKSVFIANLETVLATAPTDIFDGRKKYLGWDDPDRTIGILEQIGVDAVSLANNHSMDFGPDLLMETIARLTSNGVAVFGAGATEADAAKPFSVDVADTNVHVFSGFEYRRSYDRNFKAYARSDQPGVNPLTRGKQPLLADALKRFRALDPGALLLVYPHWGGARNYEWATSEMQDLSASFVTQGADLVLGHGAHRLQELNLDRVGSTVFSLGNFVFNSPGRYSKLDAPPYSLVARLKLERLAAGTAGSLKLYPIFCDNRVSDFRSRPVTESEAMRILAILRARVTSVEAFDRSIYLERDERGWFLATDDDLSPLLRGHGAAGMSRVAGSIE